MQHVFLVVGNYPVDRRKLTMQERDGRPFASMNLSGPEGKGSSEQGEGLASDSRKKGSL